jgi:protein-tyrosine-phosphatase
LRERLGIFVPALGNQGVVSTFARLERSERAFVAGQYRLRPEFQIAVASCDPRFVTGITIHFVCTGNVYRSRLAEAYCASKRVPGIHAISSGIAAGLNGDAPISPYAAEVLEQYHLDSYAAARWQPTTAALVRASDVLVFMESEHRRFCEKWLEPARQQIEVWEIEDVGPVAANEIAFKVQRTFRIIRQRTDELLATLVPKIGPVE